MANQTIPQRQRYPTDFLRIKVCQKLYYLPLLCLLCAHNTAAQMASPDVDIPPVDIIAEKTAHLLDNITNTDFSTHHRFVAIQTSLTEIYARIKSSSIHKAAKQKLKSRLDKLDSFTKDSMNTIISMRITFRSALDKLQICKEYILDGLSRIRNGESLTIESEGIGKNVFAYSSEIFIKINFFVFLNRNRAVENIIC
jgi:hypothetical protein